MPELKSNPIVDALGENESAIQVEGYIGRSENGQIRVYSGLDLQSFLVLDASDVIHVIEGDQDDEPARLYLRDNAEVEIVSRMKAVAFRQKPTRTGSTGKKSCADKSFDFWWDCVQRPGGSIDDCTAHSRSMQRICELIESAFETTVAIEE